jgi:ABC-type transporter Mla maintaining outer membrane lipid asymmetry ATPase subunit MlaF
MYAWGTAYMLTRGEQPTCGMDPPKDGAIERLVEQLKAAQFQSCCGE